MNDVRLTDDEFEAQFKPMQNHLDSNASWNGQMFETFGPEFDYVRSVMDTDHCRVWTIVDAELMWPIIVSGYHYVNRIGYIITEVPFGPNIFYEVSDPDNLPDDGDDDDQELT